MFKNRSLYCADPSMLVHGAVRTLHFKYISTCVDITLRGLWSLVCCCEASTYMLCICAFCGRVIEFCVCVCVKSPRVSMTRGGNDDDDATNVPIYIYIPIISHMMFDFCSHTTCPEKVISSYYRPHTSLCCVLIDHFPGEWKYNLSLSQHTKRPPFTFSYSYLMRLIWLDTVHMPIWRLARRTDRQMQHFHSPLQSETKKKNKKTQNLRARALATKCNNCDRKLGVHNTQQQQKPHWEPQQRPQRKGAVATAANVHVLCTYTQSDPVCMCVININDTRACERAHWTWQFNAT